MNEENNIVSEVLCFIFVIVCFVALGWFLVFVNKQIELNYEAERIEEQLWLSEKELTNEEIVELSTVCINGGLDFELGEAYASYEQRKVVIGVVCVPKKQVVPVQNAGSTESIDSEVMSVGEYVGVRVVMGLLGF